MTFLNDSKRNISEEDKIEKMNENIGFKCTSHNSKENNEFRYYCLKCNENLCKECIPNHIKKEKDCYFLHDIIILDFQNIQILKKLKEIQNKLELENENRIKKLDEDIEQVDCLNDNKNLGSILNDLNIEENFKEKVTKFKLI